MTFIIEFLFIIYCILLCLLCNTIFHYNFSLYAHPSIIIDYKYFTQSVIDKIKSISAPFIKSITLESSSYTHIVTLKVININKNIHEINTIIDYIVSGIDEQRVVKIVTTNCVNPSETIVFYILIFITTILILYYRHSYKRMKITNIIMCIVLSCVVSYVLILYLESITNIISDHYVCNTAQNVYTNSIKSIYTGVIIYFASYIL